ncbi:MAG: hypothetical protein ACK4TF_06785 [Thermodesulfovibrionales bacterium]
MAKVTIMVRSGKGYFKWYIWIILLFIALFLQSKLVVFGIKPEFLSALVFIFGMRTKEELKAAGFGAFAGLVEDIFSDFWGPNMVSKCLIGYLSANILGGFFVWSPLLGIIGIFFITLIDSFLAILVMALKDVPIPISGWVIYTIFIQALINVPLGYFAGESKFCKENKIGEPLKG